MPTTLKVLLIVLAAMLASFALFLGLGLAAIATSDDEPAIAPGSVLWLRVSGELPDYIAEDPIETLLEGGRRPPSLASLLEALEKASVDKRIEAVVLQVDALATGWAEVDELRAATAELRSSGKPVYAYLEQGGNLEYYLALAADKVFVAPAGTLFIQGLASEVTFFRGTLDKVGVYPDSHQIGQYKNAVDQFTRKEMSPAHREVIDSLLDDLHGRYVATISEARKKTRDDVRQLIDGAPYTSVEAEKLGLTDGAKFRDELTAVLNEAIGRDPGAPLKLVRSGQYAKVSRAALGLAAVGPAAPKIAVVYASGSIGLGRSDDAPLGGNSVGSDTMVKALEEAARRSDIRGVVLRVDSPGGSALASDIIWRAIERVKEKKPVVVSMGGLAASGGYYISAGANRIIAAPSTLTGSIGVFALKPVVSGLNEWLGLNTQYVLRGQNAGMFRATERFTPSERERFEALMRAVYEQDFLPKVAQGRSKDLAYVDSVGQGRVWSGAQALEKGLVDGLGGLSDAIATAKELAGIPERDKIERVVLPEHRGFLARMLDVEEISAHLRHRSARALVDALPAPTRELVRTAAALTPIREGEVMARMPFEVRMR